MISIVVVMNRKILSIAEKLPIGLDLVESFKSRSLFKDESAESPAHLVTELTQTALIVALVLIPIGLYYLNNANTSGMPTNQVLAIGSIGIIIVVSIVLSILNKAMHKGK